MIFINFKTQFNSDYQFCSDVLFVVTYPIPLQSRKFKSVFITIYNDYSDSFVFSITIVVTINTVLNGQCTLPADGLYYFIQ